MGVGLLHFRPRGLDRETQLEQEPGEIGLPCERDAEPLDRASGLDDRASFLPERALRAGTELPLSELVPEAAFLRSHT